MTAREYQYVLNVQDKFGDTFSKLNQAASLGESKIVGVQKKLNETEQAAGKLDNVFGGLKTTIAGVFAVGAISSFASSVLTVGSNFESAEIGLKTLLGSSEKAREVFQNIKKDAETTPFDFNSLLMGNKALIATGLDANTARKDILNLANAIAATGGGNDELSRMAVNMQQIQNIGKATAMDIKQFAYAGINIYGLLAKATGKSVEQVRDMEVSYSTLTKALDIAAQKGGDYYKGLENAANSTQGRLSNLSDKIDAFKDTIFNMFYTPITMGIELISIGVGKLQGMINFVTKNSSTILNILKNTSYAVGILAGAWGAYQLVSKSIIAIDTLRYMWMMRHVIAETLLTTVTGGLTGVMASLNAVLMANPIGLVTAGIVAAVGAVIWAYNEFDGFRETVWGLYEAFKEVFGGIAKMFKATFEPIVKGIEIFNNPNLSGWEKTKGIAGQMGQLALNLTPHGIAMNMAEVASTTEIKKAFNKGVNIGKTKKPLEIGQLMGGGSSVTEIANASGGSPVGGNTNDQTKKSIDTVASGGSRAVNVTVNVSKFLDKIADKIEYSSSDESAEELESKFLEMFARVINGGVQTVQ